MAISVRQKIVIAAIIFYATFAWTAAAHAAIIKPANNLGLIGYWNLDERNGTIAHDHSASQNSATITSPTWVNGKLGGALQFAGSPQIASSTLHWPSSAGSISEWVYPTGYADWISPAGWKLLGTNNGYILIDNGGNGTPGKWRAVFNPNNTTGPGEQDVVALQNDTLNTWQHLVFTWSLSGTTYTTHLYVNGVDQGTATWAGTIGANGVGNFHFGNSGDYPDNYFLGKVDDVRVYNRALSLTEVKALYNQTVGTRYNSSASTLNNGSTLTNGLVGWWTFDGSTIGTTIQDSSGQGNNGYIGGSSATSTMEVAGKLGQALNFFSSKSSYVNVTNQSPFNFERTDTFSEFAWFKTSSSLNQEVAGKNNGGGTGYEMVFPAADTSKVQINLTNTSGTNLISVRSSIALNDGKWHYVGFTYNGSSVASGVKLYIDGVLDSSTVINDTLSGSIQFANDFGIGKRTSGGVPAPFNGTIDDVRVYNRALSAAEVKQLYQEGAAKVAPGATLTNGTTLASGLVGYWSFNGADVTDKVYDRSGQGNNGYFYNGATSTAKVQGKLGQALNFSAGTSQEVVIGTAPAALTFAYNQSFSISVWAKPLGTVGSGVFDRIVTIAATANNFEYFILANNNTFSFSVGKNAVGDNTVTSSTFSVGQWYHLAAIYDGTNLSFYMNGTSIGTTAYTFGALTSPNGIFSIGGAGNSANVFNGTLDETRVYNRALSAAEVKQLYQLGK